MSIPIFHISSSGIPYLLLRAIDINLHKDKPTGLGFNSEALIKYNPLSSVSHSAFYSVSHRGSHSKLNNESNTKLSTLRHTNKFNSLSSIKTKSKKEKTKRKGTI